MAGLMKMEEWKRDHVMHRGGYHKIIKSCEQAKKDGYGWSWIDTSLRTSELSEAINSMYWWYQNAQVCYAYLHDADELPWPTQPYDPYGDKRHLASVLEDINGVLCEVLRDGLGAKLQKRRYTLVLEMNALWYAFLPGLNRPMESWIVIEASRLHLVLF
ncbi:hypothetical protein BKA82DRAFT_4357174 [Pisolithus tinctorius]|nr:hypothetical protein BKA82DRAFT_4357174 [Pisolithus tinctorius]